MDTPLAVAMQSIAKRFGSIVANDGVDLFVAPGEIHALLGENGAGKSTLVKTLFGLVTPDSGSMRLKGLPYAPKSPADAMKRGVGMVHQHFMLVDRLTVAENLMAGNEPTRRGLLDFKAACQAIEEAAHKYGLRVNPDAPVESLSVGEQQRVELLRCLLHDADVLILDEPTAVLTPQEVDDLFRVMLQLKASGKSVVFITHKLRETLDFADRVTVLRRGKTVAAMAASDASPKQLADMMVGRSVSLQVGRSSVKTGEPLLRVEGVTLAARSGGQGTSPNALDDIHLHVCAGEIVGIAGVEGNGQLELEEVIAGIRRPTSGRVLIGEGDEARPVQNPQDFRALGGAHIPSDRLRRGLIPSASLKDNGILGFQWRPPFSKRGVLQPKAVDKRARAIIQSFDVRGGSPEAAAAGLSGGNQQKFVIGRELSAEPRVIVAAQPTRGVDVGAIERIHQALMDLRSHGRAVLLISAELDELMALADRLLVMFEGRVIDEGPTGSFDPTRLGLLMAGQAEEGMYA